MTSSEDYLHTEVFLILTDDTIKRHLEVLPLTLGTLLTMVLMGQTRIERDQEINILVILNSSEFA